MTERSKCQRFGDTLFKSQVNIVEEEETKKKVRLRIAQIIVYGGFLITIFVLTFEFSKTKLYEYDYVKGVVTTLVTGSVYATDPHGVDRTWDVTDLVIPPRGPDEFVVMTHILPSLRQTQGTCDEHPSVKAITCQTDEDCEKLNGTILEGSHGRTTGRCVQSQYSGFAGVRVCEIFAWCPVNIDNQQNSDTTVLDGTKGWTVLIKNDIEFPKFGDTWGNHKYFGLSIDVNDLNTTNCLYDKSDPHNKFCPIFKLQTIVEGAEQSYENIARTGGVIRIIIKWDCNMKHLEDCAPEYTFKRMDRIHPGYEIRLRTERSDLERNYFQANGIRFLVTVEGWGKSYRHLYAALTLGSYFGYISVVSFGLYYILYWMLGYSKIDSYMTNSVCKDCINNCMAKCRRS